MICHTQYQTTTQKAKAVCDEKFFLSQGILSLYHPKKTEDFDLTRLSDWTQDWATSTAGSMLFSFRMIFLGRTTLAKCWW